MEPLQSTLDKLLEEYKSVYLEHAEHMVNLHNSHQSFLNHRGLETGEDVRRAARKMIAINKRLIKLCSEVFKAQQKLRAELIAQRKAVRAKHPRKLPSNRKGGPDWPGNKHQ